MTRLFGLLIAVMTVTAACTSNSSPTAASRSAESPTASLSVAGPTPLPESGGVVISPGTYATNFQPKLAFTAASTGWEVNVNTPSWLGMQFPLPPPVLGTINIITVSKVFDPEHGGKLIDPPKDLAGAIARLPGVKVVRPPTPVTVGGIEGDQLDVLVGRKNVQLGPIPGQTVVGNGFGKKQMFRIIELQVNGHQIQIAFAPDEAGSKHFKAAVSYAQPLIDSITWG